jgi:hypothetical protein
VVVGVSNAVDRLAYIECSGDTRHATPAIGLSALERPLAGVVAIVVRNASRTSKMMLSARRPAVACTRPMSISSRTYGPMLVTISR